MYRSDLPPLARADGEDVPVVPQLNAIGQDAHHLDVADALALVEGGEAPTLRRQDDAPTLGGRRVDEEAEAHGRWRRR